MLSRFWTWLFRSRTLQFLLIFLLIVLAVVFVAVLFSKSLEACVLNSLGLEEDAKYEALKFLGISMGGILVALQALMSYKRAKAMEDTAQAQADAANAQARATEEQAKANQHTEQGQRQERFRNAIEHLGHEKDSVRLGGAYELFHLAQDTEELCQTVLDILCAHIRQTTSEDKYREKHTSEPSEEVQSLLTLLFVQKHEVFKDCHINLQGSWLNGAELSAADLQGAELSRTYLRGARLREADLKGLNLVEAQLQGAHLDKVHLQGANLLMAELQGASLSKARLQETRLSWARLQGASLSRAQLQGTSLEGAQLQAANLCMAQLQGADLNLTQLYGAESAEWDPLTFFANRIRKQIGRESNLSKVIFAGGLSREDVESRVEGLPNEKANELQKKLESHIDQPKSSRLPDRNTIIGSYTKEEAEQWIAEYEQAMSGVPADDS